MLESMKYILGKYIFLNKLYTFFNSWKLINEDILQDFIK